MLLEPISAISIDKNTVLLQASRVDACGTCDLQKSCGQSLLLGNSKAIELPLSDLILETGNNLALGHKQALCMREDILLKITLLFYGLPLAFLLLGAAIASMVGADEGSSIAVSAGALVLGFWWSRVLLARGRERWQPRLRQAGFSMRSPEVE